jgi:hypothetical protein
MRGLVLLAVTGALVFLAVRWALGIWPSLDIDTFVETPEEWEKLYAKYDRTTSDRVRVTPRVDVDAPVSVIRWPAFKSNKVAAVPLELRIRKDQWASREAVSDQGFIGPSSVGLRLDWPEADEARAKARDDEQPLAVSYGRSVIHRDFLYDEAYRANEEIKYATPLTAPREEAVVIYCGRGPECTVNFEYLGRPAVFSLPRRRFDDWREGLLAARRLIASVAKPIEK